MVGLVCLSAAVSIGLINTRTTATAHTQTVSPKQLGNRAARWRRRYAVLGLQHYAQLLWSPCAVQPPLREDLRGDCFIRARRTVQRPRGSRGQGFKASERVALQMLIAGLPAYAKLLAQLRERKTLRLG